MSNVLRRLYNVAYGRVRLWQSDKDEVPEVDLRPPPREEPDDPLPEAEPRATEPVVPRQRRL